METAVVIAVTAIVVLIAINYLNPQNSVSRTRNRVRQIHLKIISNAIYQNISDNRGVFVCANGNIPTSTKKIASGINNYNLAPCVLPSYITSLPFDPSTSTAHFSSSADYDTGYLIIRNATTSQITLSAPAAELNQNIFLTR